MTPSKRKGRAVDAQPDEPTDMTPSAPWDGSEDDEVYVDDAPSVNPTSEHVAQRGPAIATAGESLPNRLASLPDAEIEAGTLLGEYKIETKIGEGGMGVVYSAIHPLIGKRAAVKVLKAELCRAAFNVERFIDEARIVNQIGHQNIVDIFAFGQTTDGRSYFVMEWLKGESLRDCVARSRLDLDEICEVIRPLARALEAAHEQGVIHRDLKPDNIFLVDVRGEAPLVKLLDFGIAKLAREEHRMERTATGAMVGTPQYIAPEQAKGYAIDARVDIYALGGIIFELLTGRPPFVADNAMEMVAKHLMEPVPKPSSLTHVPPELDDLVVRMLSKDPAGRPSLAEVATVIERTSALDRTNVKTPIPVELRDREDSGPISAPLPTPSVPSAVAVPRESNPALSAALAKAMATPGAMSERASLSDMTETIRAPRTLGRKGIAAVMVVATMIAAVVAFVIVWTAGEAPETQAVRSEPQALPQPMSPSVEPPPVEPPPLVEPPAVAAIEPADPAPVEVKPDVKPAKQKPPRKAPPPKKKQNGRLVLSVSGGHSTPRVTIDGKPASLSTPLTPGMHVVEITSKGAKPKRFSVSIDEGETTRKEVALDAIPKPADKPSTEDLMKPGSLQPK